MENLKTVFGFMASRIKARHLIKMAITIFILVFIYFETGVVTTITFALVFIGMEANSFCISQHSEAFKAVLEHYSEKRGA